MTDVTGKTLNRRAFLRTSLHASALAGGGLMLQLALPGTAQAAPGGDERTALVSSKDLNFYVQIAPDGQITIFAPNPEMGQGIKTTLPMVIAEEMGAKWEDVKVVEAPLDIEKYGLQGSGGSRSVPMRFDEMRRMGASAREMLIGAASLLMEVERKELEARESRVVHSTGKSMSFGQLATAAAEQPVPDPEFLSFKDPRAYTIIGTSVGGVDNLVIASGLSKFGIDADVPGMKYASFTRCPRRRGVAVSFNEEEIKALPGVTDAFIVAPDDRAGIASMSFINGLPVLRGGVAVVGDDTWSVISAKDKLKVKWDDSDASEDSWDEMVGNARKIAGKPGGTVLSDAENIDATLADPTNQTIESFYQFPYVAHICMEPMNCTADYRPGKNGEADSLEIWYGSQFPGQVKEMAQNLLGVDPDRVTVNNFRMGGGFGRRALHDFAAEAMIVSKLAGVPVKLTWTRTDDIHNDYFRVGGFQNMQGAIDSQGKLAAWDQHYIGFGNEGKPVIGSLLFGNEFSITALPNARVRQTLMEVDTSCGAWRAPGSNTNAFVEQSFIHELAELAGRDHVEFLLELMGKRRWVVDGNINTINTGRAMDVIKLVAEKANWGKAMPKGSAQGLAFYFCHAAHIAEIAEVSVDENRNFKVDKVTVAVDVGPIINMSGAIHQVQGSIVDGLSTMALQEITMKNGEIQQDNFHEYPVMRIGATPEIDVHFLQSDNPPTGLGEPALPPLAPAVTNAIYTATGVRIRSMPLSNEGFTLV